MACATVDGHTGRAQVSNQGKKAWQGTQPQGSVTQPQGTVTQPQGTVTQGSGGGGTLPAPGFILSRKCCEAE